MNRDQFRFFEPLRVRWAEVDMQHIVFNGHYLMYFDTAVAGYWRAMAMPYHPTMASLNGDIVVRKASVEYLASARYDDLLEVGIRCDRIGNSSLLFQAAVFRGRELLVTGELVYVFIEPGSAGSRPVPDILREAMLAFEAGEPVVQIKVGHWNELATQAQPLRQAVFVQEQGIPAAMENDADDARAWHAVAVNRFGLPVGTGRLLEVGGSLGKIGRMAVLRDVRGGGVGQALLAALIETARQRRYAALKLHAQDTAIGFYRQAGFRPRGEPFEEAGLAHQEMVLAL
jgi:YbgC/YbaW family acyl-CoA thioester hydrolase